MKSILTATLLLAIAFGTQSMIVAQDSASAQSIDDKFEIDFPGGTIDEYIKQIRTIHRQKAKTANLAESLNVIVTESAKDFRLPTMQIKTNLSGALSCLRVLSDDNSEVILETNQEEDVTLIRVMRGHPLQVVVINAKQILNNVPEKDLLSAIEIGLRMNGSMDQVELKLHKETGLLFVRGTPRETQVVQDVVSESQKGLQFQVYPRRTTPGTPGDAKSPDDENN